MAKHQRQDLTQAMASARTEEEEPTQSTIVFLTWLERLEKSMTESIALIAEEGADRQWRKQQVAESLQIGITAINDLT